MFSLNHYKLNICSFFTTLIGQSRLNGLALMNIHRDIQITTKKVINKFSIEAKKLNFHFD